MKNPLPSKHNNAVFWQICNLIPSHFVSKLAQEYGIDKMTRSFSAWSHIVALLYGQFAHCISLNDLCDGLRNHASKLACIRGATPPSRNGLSHANKTRNSDMMEALFYKVLEHLQERSPKFGMAGRYEGLPYRFRRAIHAIDSSTIALVANCMDWAKHRRRKAAAKMHINLNLQTFLPNIAIIEEAGHHDDTRMIQLCAHLQAGEIALFDRAYMNFAHLFTLTQRDIFWVTRAKENLACKVVKKHPVNGKIIRDEEVVLTVEKSKNQYTKRIRRVEAWVEVDGKEKIMVFLTNNMKWAAVFAICTAAAGA